MLRFCFLAFACALLTPLVYAKSVEPAYDSFDSDGVAIHYSVRGEGEPVLFIHGYTASASLNFGMPGLLDAAAERYRVIALDNRGHGKSDKPERVEDYGAVMAEDSIRLLDHLGIDSAHVVGYSMGGMIAMKLLTEHPDRIRSAIVGGMGWVNADGIDVRAPREDDPNGNKALQACAKAFPELGITEDELKAIKTPTTVIIGDADGFYQRSVQPLEDVRPDIPVVMIEGANHTNCCFKPAFREAMMAFLDAQ